MTNNQIAALFDEVADLLEFQGANPFRVRAYRNGARRINDLSEPAQNIVADPARKLTDLEGIGKDLDEKIQTIISTGSLPLREELVSEIPESVLALLRVPGLGPKKAAALYAQLGIADLQQLQAACEKGEVRGLKGFGKKTEATILAGIGLASRVHDRMRWADADEIVALLLTHLREAAGIRQLEAAGSYRRGCETIGDVDLLVDAPDHEPVMDRLAAFEEVDQVLARGETKMSVRLRSGLQVDLRVVPPESFGAALQYFTGSKAHNVAMRGMGKERGLKINEWGVFRVLKGKPDEYLGGKTEDEVYQLLQLPCFPPELREAREEFQWAADGSLPPLLQLGDLRGDLHMHTTATDGKASLEEMAAAAQDAGHQYIAITDHSQRVSMAEGLDADRLRAQWQQIDAFNRTQEEFVVLKGIECDILEQGGMDLADDVLAEADWVIASLHYGQNQSATQITDRIIGAIENPHVSCVGHPTGRLINRRDAYAVDVEAMLQAASEHHTMLELNAHPSRLDLNDTYCAAAKRMGVPVVINTDAHSVRGLSMLRYGVLQARRGGLTAGDVANTRTLPQLRELLQ